MFRHLRVLNQASLEQSNSIDLRCNLDINARSKSIQVINWPFAVSIVGALLFMAGTVAVSQVTGGAKGTTSIDEVASHAGHAS